MASRTDTEHEFTNDLAGETSPYLLQHAHNPVDWMPWGEAAFEAARRLDRPIFLSIGYSTCYWCHVMERQSFEDPAIAEQMNAQFVCVKVDREERPDLDDIYMTATQVMTRRGGWPMSVFLTPPGAMGPGSRGLKPFFCGTYYPPAPTGGMPGFPQVLRAIHDAWHNQREVVLNQADELVGHVKRHLERKRSMGELSAATIRRATDTLMQSYDREHGGFGSAPKFPTPNNLLFLLAALKHTPQDALRAALAHTLDRMARGGVYDQVGGGFHRYSVDEQWLVPHFEKMLYDNGQLLEVYAAAHELGIDRPQAARVMRETADYVLREMTDTSGGSGGFWSAQDAEVDGREGGNYVWTVREVADAIADEALRGFALSLYGLDLGPNFRDPHHPDARPVNVLYLPAPLSEDDAAKRQRVNALLKTVRDRREQPATDDKVLTAWNGMMIAGLARAGAVLDEPRFVRAAARAADAIVHHLGAGDGGLLRTLRRGRAKIPAFLEDYAHFAHGLVELHRATGDGKWRRLAERYTDTAIARFAAEGGGFHDTLAGQDDLFVRSRSIHDGATPCGASQMVHNLIDLDRLDRAAADLRSYAHDLAAHGPGMAHMQHALLRLFSSQADLPRAAAPPRPQPKALTAGVEPVDVAAGEYRVVLTIAPGYHVHANPTSDPRLTATTLEPGDVTYPPPMRKRYPFSEQELAVYEGTVELAVRVDPSAPPRELVLTCQPCTDRACEEPARLVLPLE